MAQVATKIMASLTAADLMLLAPVMNPTSGYPEIGGVLIQGRLGAGGMGTVYKGFHKRLEIPVAIKVWSLMNDSKFTDLFTEARLAAKLNHPNVVRVYDVDLAQHLVFIVQEFVEGVSAFELLGQFNKSGLFMPETRILEICADVARGLICIHRAGIVHRDIKPSNIMVQTEDGTAKVADLGLAQVLKQHPPNTRTREAVGTPGYISPEQIQGFEAGPEADLYALGSMLFELATHQYAFGESSESEQRIMQRQLDGQLPDLRKLRPDLSAATQRIIERCLQPDPSERFNKAGELFEAIVEARMSLGALDSFKPQDAGPKAVVVCVDDDPFIRELLEDTLTSSGYEPHIFSNGTDAMSFLKGYDTDMIILDVEMPGQTGVELCALIRAMPLHRNVPILFLSSVGVDAVIDSARLAGGTDYLNKPVQPPELLARVKCLVQLYHISREREALSRQYAVMGSRFGIEKTKRLRG